MSDLVVQKSISLLLLIAIGYLLKRKFQDPGAVNTIRNFILNVALPATIFLSIVGIDTRLNLLRLPSFALAVNIFLMLIGLALSNLLFHPSEKAKQRALILLFPSLAPGLTVYPFIEQFVGRQGLAWAALADAGNKLFVLLGLYILAIYWYRRSVDRDNKKVTVPWKSIGTFLICEPVNIAILIGFLFVSDHLNAEGIPFVLNDTLQKLAVCATPLILFYIGISLNLKSLQFGRLLTILFARTGAGLLFSAITIAILHPTAVEETILFIALPQASCSLWPLLHAARINSQDSSPSSENASEKSSFFDINFATAFLALSFPFSIFVLLMIFSSGSSLQSPLPLATVGCAFLLVFAAMLGTKQLKQQQAKRIDQALMTVLAVLVVKLKVIKRHKGDFMRRLQTR